MSHGLLYVDSSALVKLVVEEPESGALMRRLRDQTNLVSSAVAVVEVERAARRTSSDATTVARAREVMAAVHLLAVDGPVLERAAGLGPLTLRTLDAIHLASALSIRDDLDAVVVYDDRLAAAAGAAGLTVLTPR